jgi:hypothetical protein
MNDICDNEIRINCVDRLARIEQMLKDRIEQSRQEQQRVDDILIQHEHRIWGLEKWRNWVLGACGVLGAIGVGAVQWFKNHLQFQP